ncbi:MAG: 50S ribosomal protein L5 [Conexivisphaerales archaeon]|nr:50S ribosomal protein L5 [Conexivisphaerales archaeon]
MSEAEVGEQVPAEIEAQRPAMAPVGNPMRTVRIAKVVLNIGVGASGERLEKAVKLLENMSGQTPSVRNAKSTIRGFGIHRGEPIAAMVTLRGRKALELLNRLLDARGRRILERSFDNRGNVSFGIKEHIDIPGMKYDPEIGIFGMDVSVSLERPGYRVARRRRARSSVGKDHVVSREDAINFFRTQLNVEVAQEIG